MHLYIRINNHFATSTLTTVAESKS